MLLEFY